MRHPGYVAPEVLKAGQDEYPNNVDMFSLGVVAYTLCGYEPFFGRNEHELMLVNKHIQFEFHCPSGMKSPKVPRISFRVPSVPSTFE